MKDFSMELIVTFFFISFILGGLCGILVAILRTTRIAKKDEKEFDIFLIQRENRIKDLAKEARELQKNYY